MSTTIWQRYRAEILDVAKRHGARNVRVFGSQARGEGHEGSDLDLLVTLGEGRSLLGPRGTETGFGGSRPSASGRGHRAGSLPLSATARPLRSDSAVSRDALYLQHVPDAIGKVERYVTVGRDEFMAASHWQDAVIRQLEIIGEAVKHISPETLGHRPDIPWRRIAGMRDVLIHDYMGVDLEAVWQVTQNNLAQLRQAVEKLLSRDEPSKKASLPLPALRTTQKAQPANRTLPFPSSPWSASRLLAHSTPASAVAPHPPREVPVRPQAVQP